MTVLISGTNGVSDVDGSVGTPAIRGTDANTGIYFPAANQVAVSLNGVRSILFTGNGAFVETSSIPLTINSTNSNAYKIGFQDNTTATGFLGATATNAFKVANGSATDVLNVTSAGVLQMNSGYGSVANAYGVRAWANFTGGNPPSQITSGGISSITYGGVTGVFIVSFASTMPDAGYAVVTASYYSNGNNPYHSAIQTGTKTTSGFTLVAIQYGSPGGPSFFNSADTAFAVVR